MEKIKRKQKTGFTVITKDLEISHLEGIIISSFFPEAEEMTIKEIQERTEYSYERANSALKSLVKKNILIEKNIGKTLVYSLKLNEPIVRDFGFRGYMLEKKINFIRSKKVYNAIKEIEFNPFIQGLIIFGSYAKKTETDKSDIDIICITSNKKKIENFLGYLKHKYNIKLSPIILSKTDFPDIKKDNPELWDDLKLNAILFKGSALFYYWMYKNEKN